MTKILHLVPIYKNISETFIWSLIEHSCEINDVKVVTSLISNDNHEKFTLTCINGKDSNNFRKLIYKLSPLMPFKTFFVRNELKCEVDRFEPDVIHAHFGYFCTDLLYLVNKKSIRKFIISFHGTDINKIIRNDFALKKSFKKLISNKNVVCVFPSEFLKNVAINLCNGIKPNAAFLVVPNSVNPEYISSRMLRVNRKFDSVINLVSIARLERVKGIEYVFYAIKELKKHNLNIFYNIIGDGSLRNNLYDLAVKLDILDNIFFSGYLDRANIVKALNNADIYIQPSVKLKNGQEESFGLSALEAAVTGMPIIVSDAGGLPEIINKKNPLHFIVNQADYHRISQAIFELSKCEGINEYLDTLYVNKFSQENIFKIWDEIYAI